MLKNTKIAFIGSGAMAEAIIKGVLGRELVTPEQIIASEPIDSRRDYMQSQYAIETTTDNTVAVQSATIVIPCIKPQILPKITHELNSRIDADTLILSIMAGINIATLRQGLNHARIIRTMPNTPAQVGMGATAWIATPEVTDEQREQAQQILESLGVQISVPSEEYIDMTTGLSGSGPGFVFLIIEAMIDAGVHMGFSRTDARTLALQTIAGSVELVRQSGEHPAMLRNQVTSPGGTTAAGIYELEKGGLRTLLTDAILAAYQRSCELGETE